MNRRGSVMISSFYSTVLAGLALLSLVLLSGCALFDDSASPRQDEPRPGFKTSQNDSSASQSPTEQATSTSTQTGGTRALVYGVNVTLPPGWVVGSSADSDVAKNDEIDNHLLAGERAGIFDIYKFKENDAQAVDGRIAVYIVDADRNFMPKEVVQKNTPADWAQTGQDLLRQDHELAAKHQTTSPMKDLVFSKTTIGGHLAVVHEGHIDSPKGNLFMYNADIYLINGKGVVVKAVVDDTVAMKGVVRSFIQNIAIR